MPPLTQEEAAGYCVQAPDWELLDATNRIERTYRFRNFHEAFPFVERAGTLAETEGHHPEITFGLGIRHDLDAIQEDQGTALERLHHGGKARSDRGRARQSVGLNRASAIDEQGQGYAGAYRRGEKLAKLAIGVTQYALDAPANSPGAPSLIEGGAHCPHTSCSLTGRTRAPRK
jgi:pterin-4a-carbinolamine dehydratase